MVKDERPRFEILAYEVLGYFGMLIATPDMTFPYTGSVTKKWCLEVPMKWPYEITERNHEIQNPTSREKIMLLGEYVGLAPESRVLDVACGQAGPAAILAEKFGCSILGLEMRPEFAEEGRRRVRRKGLESQIEIRTCDASTYQIEPKSWDVALCIGAAFVWGTIADASRALTPAVPTGGYVAIGEPFWRQWPVPEGVDTENFVDLPGTIERFESFGLVMTGIIAGSDDDWDRYESMHWRTIEEWLMAHPDHEDAAEFRSRHRQSLMNYVRHQRSSLGWAIFAGMREAARRDLIQT